ncbi:c-type cytochrome [Litorisediminicola beolgyonensis]|uniref:C-type cytochrome n=1 Tax=Litorisediminicola beolgyonensis TaxID=1173614 RepID=A0ABW3ZLA8_9RHOB
MITSISTARPALQLCAASLLLLATAVPGRALDEASQVALGKTEYIAHCAACHGAGGKGDGPVAEVLAKKPLDLTRISARYSGQFPRDAVQQVIDGRNMINPHGDRGMPVWGNRYFQSAMSLAEGVPHDVDVQALAFGRVAALVTYLEAIQE